MSSAELDAPPVQKEDPDKFALRGRPKPVVRFRRGLIVGATGGVAAGLITLSWLALEPRVGRNSSDAGSSEKVLRPASPEALAAAPKTYADVPVLGPPLPGDLGRPILAHERSVGEGPDEPVLGRSGPPDSNTDEERMRDRDSIAAARSSAVLVELRRDGSQDEGASRKLEPAPSVEVPGSASSSTQPPAGQLEKLDFARSPAGSTNRATLQAAASPFTLMAGTIIPASLITGLNSDLPGVVIAQVTENVRDSATGTVILVPQGARLVGRYDSVVAFGQRRALVVWNRITFPDASSIELDNQPASDASGYAGLSDGVDAHTWQLLKGIGLSTLLGVGTQLSIGSSESDLVRAIRESAQQSVANTGSQITAHDLDVQPTITIRPGWPVRAMLSKDVQLRPWRG